MNSEGRGGCQEAPSRLQQQPGTHRGLFEACYRFSLLSTWGMRKKGRIWRQGSKADPHSLKERLQGSGEPWRAPRVHRSVRRLQQHVTGCMGNLVRGTLLFIISLIYEMGFVLPPRPPRTKQPIHRKSLHFTGFTARCRGNHCSYWNHCAETTRCMHHVLVKCSPGEKLQGLVLLGGCCGGSGHPSPQ